MLFENITIIDECFAVRKGMFLLTEGQNITYIGDKPPADYRGERYDGANKVAAPGFFNLHCHIPMVLLRGHGEGLPLQRWLHERVFPFEDLLSEDDMYWGTMLGAAELLRSGAVSFTDMYMGLGGICRAVDEAGIKANLSHGTNGFAEDARFVDSNGWKGTQTAIDYAKSTGHDRIIAEASIHAEYTSHERIVRDVAEFAAENGLRIHVHTSETALEHTECKQRRGMTPVQWMNHCGVFDVPATAAHCVWIEEGDYPILAEKCVTVAHCPSSNLKLGSGIAPVAHMLESGIRVCIGTDGASSNNNLNMLEEINLASLLQKGAARDPQLLGPATLLQMACRDGAAAQGREGCGLLKQGNRADLIVFDLDRPHMQPVFDVAANIFYSAQADDICLTMVDGRVLYRDGAFTTIDIEKAKYHAARIRQEKLTKLGLPL